MKEIWMQALAMWLEGRYLENRGEAVIRSIPPVPE